MFLPEAVCLYLPENSPRCVPLNGACLETFDRFRLLQVGVLKSRTEKLKTNAVLFVHWIACKESGINKFL